MEENINNEFDLKEFVDEKRLSINRKNNIFSWRRDKRFCIY